jgi:GTPase
MLKYLFLKVAERVALFLNHTNVLHHVNNRLCILLAVIIQLTKGCITKDERRKDIQISMLKYFLLKIAERVALFLNHTNVLHHVNHVLCIYCTNVTVNAL